jgi:hypothetical protein
MPYIGLQVLMNHIYWDWAEEGPISPNITNKVLTNPILMFSDPWKDFVRTFRVC